MTDGIETLDIKLASSVLGTWRLRNVRAGLAADEVEIVGRRNCRTWVMDNVRLGKRAFCKAGGI
jgi:hypothetical protein